MVKKKNPLAMHEDNKAFITMILYYLTILPDVALNKDFLRNVYDNYKGDD